MRVARYMVLLAVPLLVAAHSHEYETTEKQWKTCCKYAGPICISYIQHTLITQTCACGKKITAYSTSSCE